MRGKQQQARGGKVRGKGRRSVPLLALHHPPFPALAEWKGKERTTEQGEGQQGEEPTVKESKGRAHGSESNSSGALESVAKREGKAKPKPTRVILSLLTFAAHFLPACLYFAVSCSPCVWLFLLLPLASPPFCLTVPDITFCARLLLLVSASLAPGWSLWHLFTPFNSLAWRRPLFCS